MLPTLSCAHIDRNFRIVLCYAVIDVIDKRFPPCPAERKVWTIGYEVTNELCF